MADQEIRELTAETALTAAAQFVVQESTDRATRAAFSLMGGMAVTTGSDADTTMAVGTLYRVDMSAWATSVRTYSLPTTAAVGERIGVYITAGNATHELAIRTTASSNDTINGTDYDAADWSKLFITGELAVFECVVANTDWIVLVDGRIPCHARADDVTGTAVSITAAVITLTEQFDTGGIFNATSDRFLLRRDGRYTFEYNETTGAAIDDTEYAVSNMYIDPDGADTQIFTDRPQSSAANERVSHNWSYTRAYSDGDEIELRLAVDTTGSNYTTGTSENIRPKWSCWEVLEP